MDKTQALNEIDETQDFYVQKLINIIKGVDTKFEHLKEIDFTSATGTGKTVMVAKLINKLNDYYFLITSLSKGQLKKQIESDLKKRVKSDNFQVYGLSDFTRHSKLKENELLARFKGKKLIWIRDEGHIATNRWFEVFEKRAEYIINFSATNKHNNGIQCNFAHTMMLRTVTQNSGTPGDALDKLIEIKEIHKNIKKYNPCALFRILNDDNLELVYKECKKRNLVYKNITDEEFDMADLCRDDNDVDVIINKLKITEGIDLRRCHVIYIDNKPKNESTIIQVIGRARRNALFWRKDLDILSKSNRNLLNETNKCFVFYNVPETVVEQTNDGEFLLSLCDTISIQQLKPNIEIHVENGIMPNGLKIIELSGKTGDFYISIDKNLGFNVVDNDDFYRTEVQHSSSTHLIVEKANIKSIYFKKNILDFFIVKSHTHEEYDEKKIRFFKIKLKCEKRYPKIDISHWESELGMNKKDRLVDPKKWSRFINNFEYRDKVSIFTSTSLNDLDLTKIEKEQLIKYSKVDKTARYSSSRKLFDHRRESTFLNEDLIPYIDKVIYEDYSLLTAFLNRLEDFNNVVMINLNFYAILPHPNVKSLKNRGYRSLDSLKQAINRNRTSRFMGVDILYWKDMLGKVKKYKDIDAYDAEFVDLKNLVKRKGLYLNENQIFNISHGNGEIKTSLYPANIYVEIFNVDSKPMINPFNGQTELNVGMFQNKYADFDKTINDREIATIGPDTMIYQNKTYIEDTAITSKITKFCKFKQFIDKKYQAVILDNKKYFFRGSNNFDFDKRCNSCLGYCVEYFAKIKLFGDDSFRVYINSALKESGHSEPDDIDRVRAATLCYMDQMKRCYGSHVANLIPTISVEKLVEKNYKPFVDKVIELGEKTKNFLIQKIYVEYPKQYVKHDPDLSVNHIRGLCDFVTQNTILDLKCTSSITENNLEQVLSYYYLSTKRTDLEIKRLIIYEAVTGKYLEVNMDKYR